MIVRLARHALGVGVAVVTLAGCGGSLPINAPSAVDSPIKTLPHKERHSRIFWFTGKEQYFTVPPDVAEVRITADGATGGGNDSSSGYQNNGRGGRVRASIPVTSGETLYVFVGGIGNFNGGWNGGGYGGFGPYYACLDDPCVFGGGGASDVREAGDQLADRVVVAGGGGGQSWQEASGGVGGGTIGGTGGNGSGHGAGGGGGGGAQSYGGSGGPGGGGVSGYCASGGGESGGLGQGGFGGFSCVWLDSGAGGGGGYYGGGGGGGAGFPYSSGSGYGGGGAGGGGSSYVESKARRVTDLSGAAPVGNGQVVIVWFGRR